MSSQQENLDSGEHAPLEDDEVFEAVAREMRQALSRQAFRVLGDWSHAEEIAQEALLQMWLRRAAYDSSRGSMSAWAMVIVRRLAVDRVRSEQAAARRDTLFVSRNAATPYDEVVDAVERVHEYEWIRLLLQDLTELQRQAIQLVYFDNMSISQAAERLKIPGPTLRTRLRDARHALETMIRRG